MMPMSPLPMQTEDAWVLDQIAVIVTVYGVQRLIARE